MVAACRFLPVNHEKSLAFCNVKWEQFVICSTVPGINSPESNVAGRVLRTSLGPTQTDVGSDPVVLKATS